MTRGLHRGLEWRVFIAALVVVDALTVGAAFWAAYLVRFRLGWFALIEQRAGPFEYLLLTMIAVPVWLAIFAACGLYRRDLLLGGTQEYARLFTACTFGFGAMAVVSFFAAGSSPMVSRGWLVAGWPLAVVATGTGRFSLRRVAYRLRRRGLFVSRAVIVGASAQGAAIAGHLRDPRACGVRVIGFLDDYLPTGTMVEGRWTVLGPPALLAELDVDEAIVIQHALTWESLHELMRGLASGHEGPQIRLAPTFFDLLTAGMSVGQRGNVPVIAVNPSRIAGLDAVLKTGFEYTVAAALLVALGPLIVCKAARRVAAGGPVLARRRFIGARGRTVEVFAFAGDAPHAARVSRLIAKGPALLNVLRGDVALIGPRPRPADVPAGAEQTVLLSVRPGLTGPVSVAQQDLSVEAALALELSYIRDYSIWRDLHIVWERMRALFERPAPAPWAVPVIHPSESHSVDDQAAAASAGKASGA